MSGDAGKDMKERLRADLRTAMKGGQRDEAKLLRALVAALDNGEAPPAETGRTASDPHAFREGSAEVERLLLNADDVRKVLLAEIDERERAAIEMEQVKRADQAAALRAEIQIAQRYLS